MSNDSHPNGCVTVAARAAVVLVYLIQSLLSLSIASYFALADGLGARRLWLVPVLAVATLSFLGLRRVWRQASSRGLDSLLLMASAPLGWFVFWGPVSYLVVGVLRMHSLPGAKARLSKGVNNFIVELFLAICVSGICALLFLPKQECASTRRTLSRAVRFLAAFLIGTLIALMTPFLGGD